SAWRRSGVRVVGSKADCGPWVHGGGGGSSICGSCIQESILASITVVSAPLVEAEKEELLTRGFGALRALDLRPMARGRHGDENRVGQAERGSAWCDRTRS